MIIIIEIRKIEKRLSDFVLLFYSVPNVKDDTKFVQQFKKGLGKDRTR